MQSRLYVNGKEVQNPVVRGMATTIFLGIISLVILLLTILLFSIIGVGIAIGAGAAGIGLGSMAVRRAIAGRKNRARHSNSNVQEIQQPSQSRKELPPSKF